MSMSSDSGPKRALLPRSAATAPTPGPPAESSSSLGQVRTAQTSGSRTNIRSACLACRRRRNRCSGGNPCNRCRALETECIYNESRDGRTRALRERGKEELELHKRLVNGIFRAVQEGQEHHLLDLIRNNASFEAVAAALDDANVDSLDGSLSQTPEDQSFSPLPRSSSRNPKFPRLQQQPMFDFDTSEDARMIAQAEGNNLLSMMDGTSDDPTIELNESILGIRYMLQPVHSRDISSMRHLSALYLSARDITRAIIDTGISATAVLGGKSVLCSHLFESSQESFNITTWASIVVNSVAGIDILFRLAWLCYVTRFLRWTINPSEQNFNLMPTAMVPTSLQLEVPHPAIIDLIPLPQIRDTMIRNFRDFTGALELAGATVYWTESIDSTIDQNGDTGNKFVSESFEQHIEDTNNFCFGKSLLTTFPELEGQIQVAEVDHIVSISSVSSPTTSLMEGRKSTENEGW